MSKTGYFVSNRHTCCADPSCAYRGQLTLIRESWDAPSGMVVGEERCPQCQCAMLFSRKLTREEKIEWGNEGQQLQHLTRLHPVFIVPAQCRTCGGVMFGSICQNYGCEGLMPDYLIEWPSWT